MKFRTGKQVAASTPSPGERRSRRRLLIFGAVVALAAWTALSFLGGVAFLDFLRPSIQNLTGTTSANDAISAVTGAPVRWARAVLSGEEVPRLHIDIKYKHLHKLHKKRDQALAQGLLQSSGDDFVPATIRIGEREVRVKLRLKGDYTDHLEGEKWSMRIHTKKKDQIFGMRRFSIQAPRTRAFQAEPVVLDHYRREGVLAPRYSFVDVSINGDDIGLMAVEESFSKEILESQKRKEGVIIRFNEDAFFANQMRNGIHGPYENFYVAPIKPFGSSTIRKSKDLTTQLEIATGLMRSFLEGRLPASEVFDVEQMTRFMAVSEVWSIRHALRWHNMRFFLNPITFRLEPIAFDVNMQAIYTGTGMSVLAESFPERLLRDPVMRRAFVRNLARIAGETRDGVTTERVEEIEAPMLAILNREFPMRTGLKMKRVERRAAILAGVTEENLDLFRPEMVQPQSRYPDAVHTYLQQDDAGHYLEFVNVLSVPVVVDALFHPAKGDLDRDALVLAEPDALPITLPATPLEEAPSPVRVRFEPVFVETDGKGTRMRPVEGRYRVEGQRHHHALEASAYFRSLDRHPLEPPALEDTLARHPFLERTDAPDELRVAPGDWRVDGSVILPDGMGLRIGPGTTLRFDEKQVLVANGPLTFRGSAESPIVLRSFDDDSLWGGLASLHSDAPHHWEHVVVFNTNGIDRNGWKLTGGVTLHDAPVRIENCRFESNQSEDALNLVRSEFELIDTAFVNTPSDAFDGDFVTGRVVGGSYETIGGDGIDVSGSDITVEGPTLSRVHDKALSIGEGSRARISGAYVDDAGTALASKDASETEISDSEFERIRHVAIMAYVKKPEYGPSQILADGIELRNVGREGLAQLGSRVVLNGTELEPEDADIDELYKQGYMKK